MDVYCAAVEPFTVNLIHLSHSNGKREEDMEGGGMEGGRERREENNYNKILIIMLCQNASISVSITFYIYFCAAFPSWNSNIKFPFMQTLHF